MGSMLVKGEELEKLDEKDKYTISMIIQRKEDDTVDATNN